MLIFRMQILVVNGASTVCEVCPLRCGEIETLKQKESKLEDERNLQELLRLDLERKHNRLIDGLTLLESQKKALEY